MSGADDGKRKRGMDLTGLRSALDQTVEWPSVYTFKFIVPRAQLNHLLALFDGHRFQQRESSGGRFIGVTFDAMMTSTEDVIAIYQRASIVDGVMAF